MFGISYYFYQDFFLDYTQIFLAISKYVFYVSKTFRNYTNIMLQYYNLMVHSS